jgi:hypothetical protein
MMNRKGTPLAAIAAVIAVILGLVGILNLWHALAAVVLIFAVWFLTPLDFENKPFAPRFDTREQPWPRPPLFQRPGGRLDVAELSWVAFTKEGAISEKVVQRLRTIAAHRLAAHGVSWTGELPPLRSSGSGAQLSHDDAETRIAKRNPELTGWGTGPQNAAQHREKAARLLGRAVLGGLTSPSPVSPRQLESWFAALDSLAISDMTLAAAQSATNQASASLGSATATTSQSPSGKLQLQTQ